MAVAQSTESCSEKGIFSIVINLQVPASTHYGMVFYFVTKELVSGSLLHRFVDGDDEFRNSRFKLIPSVPKIDVDIGSSIVANGVFGLVIGVITTLRVDHMAFLVQCGNFHVLALIVSSYSLDLSRPLTPYALATATLIATPRVTATVTSTTMLTSRPSPLSLSRPFTPYPLATAT
ncbi:hypothetical protein Fmac_002829 [Flemingia macrophylla]|uniref:Protein ENHANCED DISEASE RESISTANCE 2 C-terminal domain-containing protein n=1 Tax=Flemingia macrophylla TaxID=520843 RepID=A0ABD1NL29_9FABA